jgi:benzoyl-CoA reductase/2-hydroxyglutaryl-CoA dehydratase subunit BcrC/BadD/HgdB
MSTKIREKILAYAEKIPEVIKFQKEDTGKKAIVNLPAYFPDEVIYSAGALPVRLWGSKLSPSRADALLQSFSCTLSRTVLEEMLANPENLYDAFLFTSMCDTFQNLYEVYRYTENAKPSHMFIIPLTTSKEERKIFIDLQFQKAREWIESITGNKITDSSFAEAHQAYTKRYNLLRKVYKKRNSLTLPLNNYEFYSLIKLSGILDVKKYCELLQEILDAEEKKPSGGPRVMLSGIVPEPAPLLRVFDELKVNIVSDDMMNSERLLSRKPLASLSPDEIVRYVFESHPCSTLMDENNHRAKFLLERIKQEKIDGFIIWDVKFCEPEGFDRPQLINFLKENKIPSLVFEVEMQMKTYEGIKTRLQSFVESLEAL